MSKLIISLAVATIGLGLFIVFHKDNALDLNKAVNSGGLTIDYRATNPNAMLGSDGTSMFPTTQQIQGTR